MQTDDFYTSLHRQNQKHEDKNAPDFPESHEEALVHMKEVSPNAQDSAPSSWKHKYIIYCNDSEKSILKLLDYIKKTAETGHSFDVVVDPSTAEIRKAFPIDGDGADRIFLVEAFEKSDNPPNS